MAAHLWHYGFLTKGGRAHLLFCISTARFSVLVNSMPVDLFNSSHGLRQEDPFSPLLFLFVMDALSKMIGRLVEDGFLQSFSMGNIGNGLVDISHLLFVDDTLIFCNANIGHIQALRAVLLCFKAVSGLRINLSKSKLVLMGGGSRHGALRITHGL